MAIGTLQKIYSDIDLAFTKKPGTKDIALSYDTQAVIRSIRNLLLTRHYERPFQPNIGSNLDAILFESIGPMSASTLKTEIERTIENFEPRANLQDVSVNAMPDNNAYTATITFFIENATEPTIVNLILQRNR
jgi:phage baseplate assembly protein W